MASSDEPEVCARRSRSMPDVEGTLGRRGERSHQIPASPMSHQPARETFLTSGRFPTERVLAERFEVGRTVVHETTFRAEVESAAKVRADPGAYPKGFAVVARGAKAVENFSSATSVMEVLRARARIEGEICASAAKVRTDCDIERLKATLAAMREAKRDQAALEAVNRLFHVRVAEATGNDVLRQMSAAMWDRTDALLSTQIKARLNKENLQRLFYNNLAQVFAAIADRNFTLAGSTMRSHIEHVISEIAPAVRQDEASLAAQT